MLFKKCRLCTLDTENNQLPDHLPRMEIIHDLSYEEKICGCGKQKDCIGKEPCEKIDFI